jgi:hypothetical protein
LILFQECEDPAEGGTQSETKTIPPLAGWKFIHKLIKFDLCYIEFKGRVAPFCTLRSLKTFLSRREVKGVPQRREYRFAEKAALNLVRWLLRRLRQGKYPYSRREQDPYLTLLEVAKRLELSLGQLIALSALMSILDIATVSWVVVKRLIYLLQYKREELEAFLDPANYQGDRISYQNVLEFFEQELKLGRQESRAAQWLHNMRVINERFHGRWEEVFADCRTVGKAQRRVLSAPARVRSRFRVHRKRIREIGEELVLLRQQLVRVTRQQGQILTEEATRSQLSLTQIELASREEALFVERSRIQNEISQAYGHYFMGYGTKNSRMLAFRLSRILGLNRHGEAGLPVDMHTLRISTGNGLLIVDGERLPVGLSLNKDGIVRALTEGFARLCSKYRIDALVLNQAFFFWGRGMCLQSFCSICDRRVRTAAEKREHRNLLQRLRRRGDLRTLEKIKKEESRLRPHRRCIGRMSSAEYYGNKGRSTGPRGGQVVLDGFLADGEPDFLHEADVEFDADQGREFLQPELFETMHIAQTRKGRAD